MRDLRYYVPGDIRKLLPLIFRADYPGYRPEVVESPHGDGKLDTTKKFAHIALKYQHPSDYVQAKLDGLFMLAHRKALAIATALGVPEAYMPDPRYGCLRILVYPPGADSHEHEDFDLFTVMLWRNQPEKFVSDWDNMPEAVKSLDAQCHLGQIGAEIGLGPATRHKVLPSSETQISAVYFAIPDHAARLGGSDDGFGGTVGGWLAERLSRSRSYK